MQPQPTPQPMLSDPQYKDTIVFLAFQTFQANTSAAQIANIANATQQQLDKQTAANESLAKQLSDTTDKLADANLLVQQLTPEPLSTDDALPAIVPDGQDEAGMPPAPGPADTPADPGLPSTDIQSAR